MANVTPIKANGSTGRDANGDITGTATGLGEFASGDTIPSEHLPAASETAIGAVELATAVETTTGTDTSRAVTPAGVAAAIAALGPALSAASAAEAAIGTAIDKAVTPAALAGWTNALTAETTADNADLIPVYDVSATAMRKMTIAAILALGGGGGGGPVSGVTSLQTTGFTLSATHLNKLVRCSGAFTISVTAATTLGAAFSCIINNEGSSIITIDPNGSETINGQLAYSLLPGQSIGIASDASALFVINTTLGGATFDPVNIGTGVVLSDGNLTFTDGGSATGTARSIRAISGKVYAEFLFSSGTYASCCGLVNGSSALTGYLGSTANSWGYHNNGSKYNNGSGSAYGSTFTDGDIIGVYVDASSSKIWFSKNGVLQGGGDPATGTNPAYSNLSGVLYFAVNDAGSPGNTPIIKARFDQRFWSYTPVSGYYSL